MSEVVLKKDTSKNKKIGILLVVILAVIGGFVYYNMHKGGIDYEENATMGILPGVDLEQRRKELQELLDNSMIAFSVNTSPIFESGTSEGNLMIENPGNNAKLIIAEMHLKDTDEIIYTSKYIKPGSYVENVKLDKVLSKGVYDAIVYFKAYDLDTKDYIGQTGAEVTLTIES